MFNLLATSNSEGWSSGVWSLPQSRCVREYTSDEITKRLGNLDPASAAILTRLPSIFAYEKYVNKAPHFGRITSIGKRDNSLNIAIEYELIALPNFLTNEELWSMETELDLGGWESSRTHWAVKDIDLSETLRQKGITLPPQFASRHPAAGAPPRVDITAHRFDVALSFPGEYRPVVEEVAKELTALLGPHTCFYDNSYQAQLARPNLDLLLQDIYSRRSKLLVVFIGADYQRKAWPNIEWDAIRSVMTTAKELQRIMYIRMDDGTVDGVFPRDGYIDARRFSPAQIAAFIDERAAFTAALPG